MPRRPWIRLRHKLPQLLLLTGLAAACTRPAPPGPVLPTELVPATAQPAVTATPPEATGTLAPATTAAATATAPRATAAASRTPRPAATSTAWPTVQTATPLFVADLPTLGAPASPTRPASTAPPLPATVPPGSTAAPTIAAFTISPSEIQPGQPVTLTWQASAEQVTLYRLDALGRLAVFFEVEPSGSMQLSPPPEQREQVSFLLNANTGDASTQATVSARILCPDTWFFANPPAQCPASPPRSTLMQAQDFERGQMLWTQYNDFIYALYADGGHPRWDGWANAWFPGQPESDPNLTPPPGLYQPVRGFGVAWRTGYVSPSQVVGDRLGWATNLEYGVPNARVQCDSAPKYGRCYLSAPGGGVYVLEPERSGWGLWTGP